MIYIVGYTFQFNVRQRPAAPSGGSIQQQIVMVRRQMTQPKNAPGFDPRFIPGDTYKLSRIQKKTVENNEVKICYLFSNISNPSLADVDVLFDSTGAGDDFIAAICGTTQQLLEERTHIATVLENNGDI